MTILNSTWSKAKDRLEDRAEMEGCYLNNLCIAHCASAHSIYDPNAKL